MLEFVAIILGVILLIPMIYAGIVGAPLVWSPKGAIRLGLDAAKVPRGATFVDIGAGTGRMIAIAAKEYGLQAIGYELSPPWLAAGWLYLFFKRARGAQLRFANAFVQDLSNVDVVFCFLSVGAMKRLKEKFENELKPGAVVISYSFSLPGWTPEHIIEGCPPGKLFVYRKS